MKKSNLSPFIEYLKSSVITFIAAFAASTIPFIGGVSADKASIIALILVGARAGVKALFEYLAILKVTTPTLNDEA